MALAAAVGVTFAVKKSEAQTQLEFGAKVALKGSWNEAAFRFERATKADPSSTRAWNNYGVALERLGRFDEAAAAYEKALALDPEDKRIRENQTRLQDFLKYRVTHTPEAAPAHAP